MHTLGRPLIALVFVALVATAAAAQQATPIEPDAMAALKNMGGYLRTLKSFQVDAVTSTEQVLDDGQKVQLAGRRRPCAKDHRR